MFSIFDWTKKELGFVIAVLVVLFGVSFYQLKLGEMKTRDAQRKADVELVGRALFAYWADHKIFPSAQNARIVACGRDGAEMCEWDTGPILDSEGVVYLKKIPIDPFAFKGWKYVYEAFQDGQKFKLSATLESCKNGVQCNWYVSN